MQQRHGRQTLLRWLAGTLCLLCLPVIPASADDFSTYKTTAGSTAVVNLPTVEGGWFTAVDYFPSGTTASIDGKFEAEGRMIAANDDKIYLQRTYGSSQWDVVATVPGTMDPSFIHVSPDGSRIALGAGYGQPLAIIDTSVLSVANPPQLYDTSNNAIAGVALFPLITYYDGDWVEVEGVDSNRYFVINGGQWPTGCEPPYDSNPNCTFSSGVGAVDTLAADPANHVGVPLVLGIPGASSDVDVDSNGNLLTGLGFATGPPNRTGELKVWAPTEWNPVNGSSLSYESNAKVVATNLLSVAYLGEDAEGNFHAGGGDAFGTGGVGENGYAALIHHGIVNDIATGNRTTPVTDGNKTDTSEYKYFAPDPCQDDSATGILAGNWGRGLAVMWNPTYYESQGSCYGSAGSASDYWVPGVTPRLTIYFGENGDCSDATGDFIPDAADNASDTQNTGVERPDATLDTTASSPPLSESNLGSPVDKISGSTRLGFDDVAASSGPSFSRYYNNQATSGQTSLAGNTVTTLSGSRSSTGQTPLGSGWSHTYSTFLEQGTTTITVVHPTGSKVRFDKNTLANLRSGGTSTLVHDQAAGTFSFREDNGNVSVFDDSGRLLRLEDANGNQTVLTYSDDLLQRVEGPFGRSLTLTYAEGRIATITDSDSNVCSYTYADGNLSTATLPGSATPQTYLYEDFDQENPDNPANNNLTGVISAGRRVLSVSYDQQDRPSAYTRGNDGTATLIEYGQAENGLPLTRTTDTRNNARELVYTRVGNRKRILSTIGPACGSCGQSDVSYTFAADSMVRSRTDGNGNITLFDDYDARHKVGTLTEASQTGVERTRYFTWHPSLNALLTLEEAGVLDNVPVQTVFDYDADGDTLANEDPSSNLYRTATTGTTRDLGGTLVQQTVTSAYGHDARGRIVSVDGPREGSADTWRYEYYPDSGSGNDSGMLHYAISPLGKTTTFSDYTYHGRPGRMLSPNGQEALITYNGRGRVTAMTEGDATVSLSYTADGIPERIEGAEGEVWEIDLDQANRQTGVTDAAGNRIEYTLNTEGGRQGERLVDSQGTVRREQTREFDANNRVSRITTVNGNRQLLYDANGNLIEQTDPRGLVTGYNYDALNRLASQTLPGETTVTTVAYNGRNKQTSLVDAEGRNASWLYDDFDNLVGLDSPDTGSRSFQYDRAGNRTAMVDALGRTTTYTYDVENRLTAIRHNSTGADLTYDQGQYGLDRLTGESTGDYSRTYAWQQNGLLASETTVIGGRSSTIAYGYDRSHRIVSLAIPGGLDLACQRDATGAITAITATYNGISHSVAENITHLPFGPISGYRQGNDVVTALGYDTDYRIASLQAGGLLDFTYTVDAEGGVLTVTDHIDASGDQSFAYDNQHRLMQASGPYGALSYTYDATGNRTAITEDSGTSTYQYAQGTSRLTAISGAQATSFGYNANGNITSKSNEVFVYNEDDRISRVWLGNNQPLAAYVYDLQGRRLRKYTAGQTCYYHYDQDGWLVAETDAAGGLVRGYVRLDGHPLAMITGDGSIYYYHNDHLGTPLRMTDATGTVVWAADYRPFGKAELLVNTVENNLRLPGQYFDSETGLHYNWHRFYDPETGRYISADPIGLDGGLNLYAYVQNNPVNWIDPWGLIWVTTGHDYHGVKNWGRWYLNRWATQIGKGLDPTFPGADPEELVGLKRDVLQEWRADSDNPCKDSEFPIGTKRRVPQEYNKFLNPGPGKVLVNNPDDPYYYQWDPWIISPTYNDYPNTKYENLYYWEQGK